jgi:tetratricopeptide (TPR) repeat protein
MTEAVRLNRSENWLAAARAWQDTADRYALLNDRTNQAYALHQLARVERELGDLVGARNRLEQAAALDKETRGTNAWWLVQIDLLQMDLLMRQTNAARLRWEVLEAQQKTIADPYVLGLFRNERGLRQQQERDWAAAAESYRQAEAAFRRADSAPGLVAVACNRAQLLMDQGQATEALAAWRLALRQSQAQGDIRRIAFCLLGQGQAGLALGQDLAAAEKDLRRAATNYRLLKNKEGLSRSLEWLARCLDQQLKANEAAVVRTELDALKPQP